MKRTVIKIDNNLCNGCGNCVVGCHEKALQLIDGNAVMISDLYCDGLGACIGECPVGAISFEEREAEPYNETSVMERLVPKGEAAILAHLKHLKDHNEHEWVRQGLDYIRKHGIKTDLDKIGISNNDEQVMTPHLSDDRDNAEKPMACGCPGSMSREIKRPSISFAQAAQQFNTINPTDDTNHKYIEKPTPTGQTSELKNFPVQLRLVNPQSTFLTGADILLAADCSAFACGDFHNRFLRGKPLVIACPKLDSDTQLYVDKLAAMIDTAKINTLTVLIMEVPCCSGLARIAQLAREKSERNIPIKITVLSIEGEVKDDEWV